MMAVTPHAFSPASPAPIVITQDNVDLDGAGRFDFEPEPHAFNVDPPAGGDGLSFTVRLWFEATGKPVDCNIGQSLLPQAAQTGCSQLMNSARFEMSTGMVMPLRRGFVDVQFSFFRPDSAQGRIMYASAYPGYTNTVINYPADATPADQYLGKMDGNFTISILPDDYPTIAMRYDMESHSGVLLGISRDGQVRNCRPISAPGLQTAYLDNYTCTVFIQRGHFEFASDAKVYKGIRYLRKSMSWQIPKD